MEEKWATDFTQPSGGDVLVMVVAANDSVRRRTKEILEEQGYLVASAGDIMEALDSSLIQKSALVILDADCCKGRYQEAVEKIKGVSPESTIAFLVGWWDERVPELSGRCQHFLYRPIRPKQMEEFLSGIFAVPEIFSDTA